MKSRRSAMYVFFSVGLCACNSSSSGPAPAASTSATAQPSVSAPIASASGRPPHPNGPGHGGMDAMFFEAARQLPTLTPEETTKLDAIEGQLHDNDPGPRESMKTLSHDLATQVRAGKIDVAPLKPEETAIDTAMQGMQNKQATALGGLHDALDITQRKAVGDAIQAGWAAHAPRPMGGDHDAGAIDWTQRRLARLTSELGLDAAQQKQVGAALAKQAKTMPKPPTPEDAKAQMDTLVTAFEAEKFDAAKTMATLIPHEPADNQVTFVTQILPVLHPDQREKLAASLERPEMGHGGPGMGGFSGGGNLHGRGGGGGGRGGGGRGGGGGGGGE